MPAAEALVELLPPVGKVPAFPGARTARTSPTGSPRFGEREEPNIGYETQWLTRSGRGRRRRRSRSRGSWWPLVAAPKEEEHRRARVRFARWDAAPPLRVPVKLKPGASRRRWGRTPRGAAGSPLLQLRDHERKLSACAMPFGVSSSRLERGSTENHTTTRHAPLRQGVTRVRGRARARSIRDSSPTPHGTTS